MLDMAMKSLISMQLLVEGEDPTMMNWITDVRDVARAHVLAAETPTAKGRYIVAHADTHDTGELYEALAQRFPGYSYPKKEYKITPTFDNSKVCRAACLPCL